MYDSVVGNRPLSLRVVTRTIFSGLVGLCVFLASNSLAQGLRVNPLKMELKGPAGATIARTLELRNTKAEAPVNLRIIRVPVRQSTAGRWKIVRTDRGEEPPEYSAIDWLSVEEETLEIEPLTKETVRVSLDVPLRARGFYVAGLLCEPETTEDTRGLSVVVRYLVIVGLRVSNRAVRPNVELIDLKLAYAQMGGASQEKTALLRVCIENKGRTYSALEGDVDIAADVDGRWRPVGRMDIERTKILPLTTLELPFKLHTDLPGGRYKIDAGLRVNGRRIRPLSKKVEFAGVPGAKKLPVDALMELSPNPVELKASPGGTRSTAVRVANLSGEMVQVHAAVRVPESIQRPPNPESGAPACSGADWLQVLPGEFPLRGNGRRTVRLAAQVPRSATPTSHRYAELVVRADYPDGKPAGENRALVVLRDPRVPAEEALEPFGLDLGKDESGAHVLSVTVENTGTVHVIPTVKGVILTTSGERKREVALEGGGDRLLPGVKTVRSGRLDLQDLGAGVYELQVRARAAGKIVGRARTLLRITEGQDGRRVSLGKANDAAEAADE